MANCKAVRNGCRLTTIGRAALPALLMTIGLGELACGQSAPSLPQEPSPQQPSLSGPVPSDPNPDGHPPPISGGTLLVTRDSTVVAADPDRDSVWLIDGKQRQVRSRLHLAARSEPGRGVEDWDGNVHIALRRSGQVASINPRTGTIFALREVCPAPRGIAYDSFGDRLHVACAGGELVTLGARGGSVERRLYVAPDLRDVLIWGDHLLVSRFRSAELIELDAAGKILQRVRPSGVATTAWRTIAMPAAVLMLHQQASNENVTIHHEAWCYRVCSDGWQWWGPTVLTGLTLFRSDPDDGTLRAASQLTTNERLPIDVAIAPDRPVVTLAATGRFGRGSAREQSLNLSLFNESNGRMLAASTDGGAIAVAFDLQGTLWIQSSDPPEIHFRKPSGAAGTIPLPDAEAASDPGRRLFYKLSEFAERRTGFWPDDEGVACASCHPEAGDDGHSWNFDNAGPRRTQSLRGGLLATAPFHWAGDFPGMPDLMAKMFYERMRAKPVPIEEIYALAWWLDAQPGLPKAPPRDPPAVERGRLLFHAESVGCAQCHMGPRYSNNRNEDVGTGQPLQVPSLKDLTFRAPYMHDGCAKSIRDRFNPTCGGDRHGSTAHLSPGQIDDLVAYLETL